MTYIYRFITYGTLEEKIYKRQILKEGLSKRVVDNFDMCRPFDEIEVETLLEYDDYDDRIDIENSPTIQLPVSDALLSGVIQEHREYVYDCCSHSDVLQVKGLNNIEIEGDDELEITTHKKRYRRKKNNTLTGSRKTDKARLLPIKKGANPIWLKLRTTIHDYLTPKPIVRKKK